jgi:hypothetical protein
MVLNEMGIFSIIRGEQVGRRGAMLALEAGMV